MKARLKDRAWPVVHVGLDGGVEFYVVSRVSPEHARVLAERLNRVADEAEKAQKAPPAPRKRRGAKRGGSK